MPFLPAPGRWQPARRQIPPDVRAAYTDTRGKKRTPTDTDSQDRAFVWVPTESRRTTVRGSGGVFYDQSHFNYNDVYINQTLLAVRRYSFNSNDSTTDALSARLSPCNAIVGKPWRATTESGRVPKTIAIRSLRMRRAA